MKKNISTILSIRLVILILAFKSYKKHFQSEQVCHFLPTANAFPTKTILHNTIITPNTKIRYNNIETDCIKQNPINIPYSSALNVLQTYKSLHGNLALPRRYTIPSSQKHLYPSEWHNVDISHTIYDMKWWQKHVHSHPNRVSQLNSLGFLWERLQPEWNLVLQALIVYKSIYPSSDGALLVPVSFVVPYNNTAWPQSTWGLHLGNQVYRIRTRQDFIKVSAAVSDNRIFQLNGLGFVWDVQEYHFQKVVDALIYYKRAQHKGLSIHSTSNKIIKVPTTFTIPNTTQYPKYLWGFPLGAKCCAIRSKELYVKNNEQRKRILQELGFNFKGNAVLGWLDVVHALAIYSKLHGGRNVSVPQNFIVPEQPSSSADWPWPEPLWGLPLGQRVRDIKSKGRYLKGKSATERKAQLYTLGINLFDDDDEFIINRVIRNAMVRDRKR